MPSICAIFGCKNTYAISSETSGRKIQFFSVPKVRTREGKETEDLSQRRRLLWIKAINRIGINNVSAARHHLVCSDHFISGKPAYIHDETNPDWVPSLNLGHGKPKATAAYQRRKARDIRKKDTKAATILLQLAEDVARSEVDCSETCTPEPDPVEDDYQSVEPKNETPWMELVYHDAMEEPVETGPQDMERALYNNIKQEAPDVSDADCDTNQEPAETEQQDVGGEFYNIKQEPTSVMINADCDTNKEPVETEQQDVHRDLYNSIKQESLGEELPCVYIDCDTKQEPPGLDYSHEPKIWKQCAEKTETQSSCEGYFPTNTPVNENYRTMTHAAQDSQLDRTRQVNGEECSLAKERPFKCHLCHKAFTQERYVKDHVKIHTQEKAFKCNLCDRAVTTKTNLIRHIRTHTQERPFRCQICDKAFTQKPHLNNHYRVHTQERPFKCSMCDYDFKKKGDLDRHIKVHSQEKPYKCQMCDKAFTLKSYLILHIRNHTQEKPFKCNLCEKAFSQKNSLNQHMRIHTQEKPFKCLVCHKPFTVKNNLNRHIKIHAQDCIQYSTI